MPVAPLPWAEARNCTVPAQECPQTHFVKKVFKGSEDCLYLDIYRPLGTTASSNLPVMLWIHGGAFIFGSEYGGNTTGRYNGTNLATEHNVIVVSVQYRLSIFGFLALPDLAAESIHNTTGNYAMQDQRLAMQWVQDNIAAFGGDRSRVLLFGESAGGGSVCYHYTSPASAGLFSSVVAESPVCSDPEFFLDYDAAVNFGKGFVKHIGCGDGGLLTLECIRALPTDDVLNYLLMFPNEFHFPPNTPLPTLMPVMSLAPVIDGSPIGVLDRPLNLIQKGIFNKVPAVFGSNENEGFLFVPMTFLMVNMSFPIDDQSVINVMMHLFHNNITTANAILAAYPSSDFFDQYNRIATILRDYFFRCNIRQMVRSIRAVTGPSVPTWIYRFNKTRDNPVYDVAGNFHGAELPFVFNHNFLHWQPEDYVLSKQMGCYWSSMADHGNPNLSGCPDVIEWPENTGADGDYNIVLDFVLRTETGLSETQCDFWDTIGYN